MDRYHARKRDAAREALAAATASQRLREIASRWRMATPHRTPAPCAAATAGTDGFIARIDSPSRAWIIGGDATRGRPLRVLSGPDALVRLVSTIEMNEIALPSQSEVGRATRAVMTWLARQRATTVSGIGLGESQYRRRLLARLDALLDSAPTSRRPALAARIGRLRAILLNARGAATDMHARALLDRTPDAAGWFDEAERRLRGDTSVRTVEHGQAEVSALLILRRTVGTRGT
jgi:hypothetical protein